jgi:hypothetical protein
MAPGERACPECHEPYGSDDDTNVLPRTDLPPRAGRPARAARAGAASGPLAALAPYKTILLLVGVLVLIVAVGYMLFSVAMLFFQGSRPVPSSDGPVASSPGPVQPPLGAAPGSPVPGASPLPGGGTVIAPAAASPSPSPGVQGVRVKVVNTEGQGANMRQRASTTAPILKTLPEGTVVEAIGGEQTVEGRAWRNIRDAAGTTGWVAAELLAPE